MSLDGYARARCSASCLRNKPPAQAGRNARAAEIGAAVKAYAAVTQLGKDTGSAAG